MNLIKKYFSLIMNKVLLLGVVVVCGIILTCMSSATPYVSSSFLDDLLSQMSTSVLYWYALIYAGLCIGQIIINYIITIVKSILNCQFSQLIIQKVLFHLSQVPTSFYFGKDISSLAQKIYGDSQSIASFIVETVAQIINNIAMVFISSYLIIKIHPLIFLVILCGFTVYIILYLLIKKVLYISSYDQKESVLSYFSYIFEQLQNNRFIKLFNFYDYFDKQLQHSFGNLQCTTIRSQKVAYTFSGTTTFITTVSRAVLLIIGGFLLLKDQISVGNFTALLSYFTLMSNSINYFLSFGQSYILVKVSDTRLQEILDYPIEGKSDDTVFEEKIRTIQLVNVGLKFDNKCVLQGLSYKFETGKIYGFCGINGSGKSTTANILCGLYNDLYTGEIFINENYIMSKVNAQWFRNNKITYAMQDPLIIKNSIFENITLGCSTNVSKEYIEKLVRGFRLFEPDNVSGRTLSYQYMIDDLGKNISGGELQKIQLIRCLLRNTDVYVFDEPTNSLDEESKKFLINRLLILRNHSIVILVTHDEGLKSICDDVIEFEV